LAGEERARGGRAFYIFEFFLFHEKIKEKNHEESNEGLNRTRGLQGLHQAGGGQERTPLIVEGVFKRKLGEEQTDAFLRPPGNGKGGRQIRTRASHGKKYKELAAELVGLAVCRCVVCLVAASAGET